MAQQQVAGNKPMGAGTPTSFVPLPLTAALSSSNGHGNGSNGGDSGVNAELLMSMMNCVDTSLFSAQQLHNWEQMKLRIKLAAEQNTPLGADVVQDFIARNTPKVSGAVHDQQQQLTSSSSSSNAAAKSEQQSVDFRQPLHREASIQDVLACLLEQQAPTSRALSSSGGSFLIHSEVKNRAQQHAAAVAAGAGAAGDDGGSSSINKPTLKSLLSSNDFSMTEKKESLRHLLSFIDNSFAAATTAEPLTQVYKDCEEGTLQRLSSLQLMRSFMTPAPTSVQAMGRTTSFEIIQAMLNATSNQAIQKPMSSQDSFRFQHLARTLESIESDVGYDNEDYGGDDVVQVDNLDNLLDYHGPTTTASASSGGVSSSGAANASGAGHALPPPHQPSNAGMSVGFVDTQALVNPSRSIYSEYGGMAPPGSSFQPPPTQQQHAYSQVDATGMYAPSQFDATGNGNNSGINSSSAGAYSDASSMNYQQQQLGAAQNMLKLEHAAATASQHQALQQQLLHQQQQHNPFQYPSPAALLQQQQQQQASGMMLAHVANGAYVNGAQQQQQFNAMLLHQQAQAFQQHQHQHPHHHAGATGPTSVSAATAQRIPMAAPSATLSQVKQHKQDAAGGAQICSALGCSHPARVKGMCKLHGGGRRCKVDGCMKSAQTGHLCIAHGGGKPCNVDGCPKTAQSRGLCKQHGGGVRCKFDGCTKSCQSGGFCRGHGGGKRCEFPNCTKWAQKNGHCAKHAQELTQKAVTTHP